MTTTPKPRTAPRGLASRQAALDILTLIRKSASLEEALAACRSFDALEGADRRFARALATTVLRRQGTLDALIAPYIGKPLPRRAARVQEILRLAAAQSALLGAPDHAVVSTAVALAKAFRETQGYGGLVNAITRKIALAGPAAAQKQPLRIDTPAWLWRAWERAYGPAAAKRIAEAHRNEPPLDLTLKHSQEADQWSKALDAETLPSGTIRIHKPAAIADLPGYDDGAWWVQDAAAAWPARLLDDVRGKLVYDLCAAPGGKTLQLAAAGATVKAVDISGRRLKLLADNLQRTSLKATTVKADVLEWSPDQKADAVLLDAPCTATGTIRRHPDILQTRRAEDVAAMAAVQSQMIDRAVTLLKDGGVLVFATCSLQPEEGEKQIAAALARHAALERIPIAAAEIGGLAEAITRDGDLRTLPFFWAERGGMDGFFAARLRWSGERCAK